MAVEYIGDGNDDGCSLGQNAADKVSLHGATPCIKASHITDLGTSASGTEISVAVNAILLALENKGILATS